MKQYLRILLSGALLFCLTIYDSKSADVYLNGDKLLKVFEDINQRYHVHFTYDREIVENIKITINVSSKKVIITFNSNDERSIILTQELEQDKKTNLKENKFDVIIIIFKTFFQIF